MVLTLKLNFIDHIKQYIIKHNLYNTGPRTLYSLDDLLNAFQYVLSTGSSWRSLSSPVFKGLYKWQSIYHHFNKFCKLNVFMNVYTQLLDTYFKSNKSGKLKYLSVDTSFIKNDSSKHASFGYKGKRSFKLSVIVDTNGIPISALVDKANKSDQKLVMDNLDDMLVEIDYRVFNNKTKRYMLADSIYDTRNIKEKIKLLGITPVIYPNKRNTKKPERLRKLRSCEKKIYKKRIIVENFFCRCYKNRRLSKQYEKNINTYMSFLYMGLTKLLVKRMICST